MGNKAFDVRLGRIVTADESVKKGKWSYLCPECLKYRKKTPVYLREQRSMTNSKTFVSYDVKDHHKNCSFPTSEHYVNDYSPTFDPNTFIAMLNREKVKSQQRTSIITNTTATTIREHSQKPTLNWLYRICSNKDNTHLLAPGYTVESICLKESTLKYWYGNLKDNINLLVIGDIKSFDKTNNTFDIIINPKGGNKYTVKALFKDTEDFNYIFDELHKYRPYGICVHVCFFGTTYLQTYNYFNSDKTYSRFTFYLTRNQFLIKDHEL